MKVHEEEYKGLLIEIYQDEDAESPRTWDNLGTMVCWHRNYDLGDEQPKCSPKDFLRGLAEEIPGVAERIEYWEYEGYNRKDSAGRVERIIEKAIEDHYIMLSLYLYDHSGITMSTSGFSCPWDSGQVGFIYVSKERLREEYGRKKVTKKLIALAENHLKAEVEIYDDCLQGNVYGYRVFNNDEEIASCWGFLGCYDRKGGVIDEAKSYIDYYRKTVNSVLPFEEAS